MARVFRRSANDEGGGFGRWLIVVVMLGLVVPELRAQFQREDPQTPAEIVDYFVRAEVAWQREHDHIKRQLRRHAEECAPIIAKHLALPEDLDQWEMDGDPPVGKPLSRAMRAVFAHRLLQELGGEHGEPILKDFFKGSQALFMQSAREIERLAQGKAEDAELIRLLRAQDFFGSLMARSIRVAVEMHSPVLVEPVLEYFESGLEHRSTHWADYALIHSPQHEDVIPRLRAIMQNPSMPKTVRDEIGRAFERYAASLV